MSFRSISVRLKFLSRIIVSQKSRCRLLSTSVDENVAFQSGQINVFMELLGCQYHQAYRIINKHKCLGELDQQRLERAVAMCKKFGIDKEEILENPDVLMILAPTIEHHSMLLQECGFTSVHATCLVNYIPLIKKRISLLRAYGYIPAEVDVGASIVAHLSPAPPIEAPPSDPAACIHDIHTGMLRRYLAWRLDATDQQLDAIFKTYVRLRHKSLRLVQRSLRLLEEELGFSREKILKNAYLIHSHPDNLLRILDEVPTLGGVPTREVMAKHPKIVMTACDTIINTAGHLKDFGLSDEAIRRCPEVFTLASASVQERLEQLRRVPEFSVLGDHPRVLRLVHYQRKAKTRLAHLQQMRVKCASLHILSAPVSLFEKYAREGADKTKGMDVTRFLALALHEDEQDIRRLLTRHLYWCHVPLLSVKETLDLLLDLGFTTGQIFKSIHVLLYPKDRVAAELNSLPHHPELLPGNLVPLHPDWRFGGSVDSSSSSSSESEDETVQAVDRRLDYVLYFMERQHHFTGNGVWPKPADQSPLGDSAVHPGAFLA